MEAFWGRATRPPAFRICSTRCELTGAACTTHGDKHALFLEAFEHYVTGFGERWASVLNAPGSPLGNVRTMLDQVATIAIDRQHRGCMVTNCAIESAHSDPIVAEALKGVFGRVGDLVRQTPDRAVEAGELSSDANTRAQTRFVVATIQGLIVLGKSTHSRKELGDVVDVAVSALR